MIAILTLLCVLSLSLLVTRVATIALSHTGLSKEAARFQARSAFTGVGFTTNESEKVVNHPVRRRILMGLMLVGNAGIVTAVSSLILTFVSFEERSSGTLLNVAFLVAGLIALWLVASSSWVDRRLSSLIAHALERYTSLNVRDYDSLLRLSGDYRVSELFVEPEDWLADKTLGETRLRDEGLNVLGIKRADGSFQGNPVGSSLIRPHDNLILYGRVSAMSELDRRKNGFLGDFEHERAVVEQKSGQASQPGQGPREAEVAEAGARAVTA